MDKLAEEQLREIIKSCVEDVWYGRRSLDPVKDQTNLLMERLVPILENTNEAKLKEELIKYEVWTHVTPDYGFAEQEVDDYLKQRTNNQ